MNSGRGMLAAREVEWWGQMPRALTGHDADYFGKTPDCLC